MTDEQLKAKAEEIKHLYEKAWENFRRDVRLGLMPDVPFHSLGEEQLIYLKEAIICKERDMEYVIEHPHDVMFHQPVRVEQPYTD